MAVDRFFSPKSIVAIGGQAAEAVIYQTKKFGFKGDIFAVHPTKKEVLGVTCYPTVSDLPVIPDAAFVGVPAELTIDIIEQLANLGCQGAVCYASGFAETDDLGKERQRRLLCASNQMPIIGPNCYGLLNAVDSVALWPDYHGLQPLQEGAATGAAIITQSGNVGINFTMQNSGLPISFVVSTGNQAGMDISDYINVFAAHPAVSVIGLHLESLTDIEKFQKAVAIAKKKHIAIVCLKSGGSVAGAQALASHTSAIAGEDSYYQALFEYLGVARVDSLEVFIETLKLLHIHPPLSSNSIATISCSGGEASLAADLAEKKNLIFTPFSAVQQSTLSQVLGENVAISNPLDYHTYIWGALDKQTACFTAVCKGVQAITCKLLDIPDEVKDSDNKSEAWQITLAAFIEASKQSDTPCAVVSCFAESLPDSVVSRLINEGIAPLKGLETAFSAIAASTHINFLPTTYKFVPKHVSGPETVLNEYDSKALLKQFGLTVPNSQVFNALSFDPDDLKIDYPLVCKALSEKLLHKSEEGGVVLNIGDLKDLQQAMKSMKHLSTVFLVEEMVSNVTIELVANIKRDSLFGGILTIGIGGVMVEIVKDTVQILLPTNTIEIAEKLAELKYYPLLLGYRGGDGIDIDLLVQQLMHLQRGFLSQSQREIEINPLLITKDQILVADALVFE